MLVINANFLIWRAALPFPSSQLARYCALKIPALLSSPMLLAEYLADNGISQSELARRVGVSQGMVWQWLNGRRRIAAEKVLVIERATDGLVTRQELRPDLYPADAPAVGQKASVRVSACRRGKPRARNTKRRL